jgi:hypothetical protein
MNIIKPLVIIALLLPLSGCYKTFLYQERARAVNGCNSYQAHPGDGTGIFDSYLNKAGQKDCDSIAQYDEDIQNSWIPI